MKTSEESLLEHARKTLNISVFWLLGFAALAVYTGIILKPPAAYTAAAAALGIIWVTLLIIFWRTRQWFWNFTALMFLALGAPILRDLLFPGKVFLRSLHGIAVALVIGLSLLRIFRHHVLNFCQLRCDDTKVPHQD